MAKPNQVPESSMEEILASIRKIISEDEAKAPSTRPAAAPRPAPVSSASNVSPLFKDESFEAPASGDDAPRTSSAEASEPDDWISARPIYPQFGELRGTSDRIGTREAGAREAPEARSSRGSSEREGRQARASSAPAKAPSGGALLSPRADAAVASAFNHLASTILTTNSRTIEQVAEDMLKPMLKDWLDENLPPLVERLVREEIERVSRRR